MTDTATTTSVETTIGAATGTPLTVPVTFAYAGVTFERSVNACTDSSGAYDEAATAARVEDVARTVKYRIDTGLLTNKPAEEQAATGTDTGTDTGAATETSDTAAS